MFDLEQQIRDWRQRLMGAGMLARETIDELECHLRDDLEHQLRAGVEAGAAWEIALQRLGCGEVLNAEFAKTQRMAADRRRAPVLKVCAFFTVLFALMGGWFFCAATLSPAQRVMGCLMTGVATAYLASLPGLIRFLPEGPNARKRITVLAAGMVAWICGGVLLMDVVMLTVALWATMSIVSVFAWLAYFVTDAGFSPSDGSLPPWPTQPLPPPTPTKTFTPMAQQALEIARAEAARLHHDFVGTEHVLLGLLQSGDGTVASVLRRWDVEVEAIRREIEQLVAAGPVPVGDRPAPFTPRVLKAMELAAGEARAFKHDQVTPGHVLLGLFREGDGVAARVLRHLRLDLRAAREMIVRDSGGLNPGASGGRHV
jgi:hypothetical protein